LLVLQLAILLCQGHAFAGAQVPEVGLGDHGQGLQRPPVQVVPKEGIEENRPLDGHQR
jgi:hypothetical protein